MWNKKLEDLTVKDDLILTGLITAVTFIPMICIGVWIKIQERKEEKTNKIDESETEE